MLMTCCGIVLIDPSDCKEYAIYKKEQGALEAQSRRLIRNGSL